MNKQFMSQIISKFDQYVQKFLQTKNSQVEISKSPQNSKLDLYDQQIQKKLKLKSKPKNTNFQKIISQMKQLNYFVSIRQVIQNLSDQLLKIQSLSKTAIGQKIKDVQLSENKGIQLQLQKIQQYLTNKQFWQRRYNNFILQQDINHNNDFQNSDYKSWMEDKLNKIASNKHQNGFNKKLKIIHNFQTDHKSKQNNIQKQSYFTNPNNIRRQKMYKNTENKAIIKHSQNFSKVSDVLTARLRKLLKTKQIGRTQKAIDISLKRRNQSNRKRTFNKSHAKVLKNNDSSRTMYRSKNISTKSTIYRSGQQWRNKINKKLQTIINDQKCVSFRSIKQLQTPLQSQEEKKSKQYFYIDFL